MKKKPQKKTIIVIIASIVALLAIAGFLVLYFTKLQYAHIDTFEKCIGSELMLGGYGVQCTTPDGRVFTQGE